MSQSDAVYVAFCIVSVFAVLVVGIIAMFAYHTGGRDYLRDSSLGIYEGKFTLRSDGEHLYMSIGGNQLRLEIPTDNILQFFIRNAKRTIRVYCMEYKDEAYQYAFVKLVQVVEDSVAASAAAQAPSPDPEPIVPPPSTLTTGASVTTFMEEEAIPLPERVQLKVV
jgi:hypothetical protein